MSALNQLQHLLRDLFQLDMADLDFGLYRLLRLKQGEVEAFLNEQLPRRVEEAFKSMAGEEQAALEKEVSSLADRIRKEIADDALLLNGEVSPQFQSIKAKAAQELLHHYQGAREKLKSVQASEAQMAEVFNHLYSFFSRYYDSGDFIPRRRYGANETYAVPYRGEEVFFHWANRDQHYVKTAETFRDYSFTAETLSGPSRIRFALTEASLPPGNLKGDTRYFFPLLDEAAWDKDSQTLRLPFHYRLPTEKEVEKYGKNSRFQEAILQEAAPKTLRAIPDANTRTALSAAVDQKENQEVSLLLKRLRHFCRRNTSDYFVHKDLEGFLKRELEFYIKDQVLHLGDLEGDLEAKRRTVRVFRQLAEETIAFLGQIENVQKRLFEKRKFVLRTDYLAPIKQVARDLWKEVLSNKEQIQAWKEIFAIEPGKNKSGKVNEEFLKEHPTLVVNTAYFNAEFKEKLLAAFNDLDEATDGILIHGENYQALRLLERKYAGKIKCIYIDPPYNTGTDEFIYKDRYQHSSWLAMLLERLDLAREWLSPQGLLWQSVDDNEEPRARLCGEAVFGPNNHVANVIWQKKYTRANDARWFSDNHDYVLVFARDKEEARIALLPRTEKQKTAYSNPDNDPRGPWKATPLHAKSGTLSGFTYKFKNGVVWSPPPGTFPRFSKQTLARLDANNEIWFGPDKRSTPSRKSFLSGVKGGVVPVTIWPYEEVGHNHEAINELKSLFPSNPFANPKPTRLIRQVAFLSGAGAILDFFSGSGTTGHAVINLNREDGGGRKFMLVEMADYFDTVLLPRIQKIMYTPDWKDGKPTRTPTKDEINGTPRLVKVLRLEGYDDALHNLVTENTLKQEEPRAKAHKKLLGENTYRLHYLVRLPLEASASMLNVEALEHPFDYKIEVLTDQGPKVETVDLVETFNYLYGLYVQRMETWVNKKDNRAYRAVKGKKGNGERILILWRDMTGLDPVVEREFLEGKLKDEGPFDEVLINGDSATPGVKSLDGLFKRLMEEEER